MTKPRNRAARRNLDRQARQQVIAWCFQSGQIDIGDALPDGALPICIGRDEPVRRAIGGLARLAHDNQTLLVPGCPEAATPEAAYDAFVRFRAAIGRRLGAAAIRTQHLVKGGAA